MLDIWRTLNPSECKFTLHSYSKPTIYCRLDYFLISESLCNIIDNCYIKPGFMTDHSLVALKLNNIQPERGPGYFRLNNSILLDAQYQTQIKQEITYTIQNNNDANPNTLWEIIKGNVRNTSIRWSSCNETKHANFKKKNNMI